MSARLSVVPRRLSLTKRSSAAIGTCTWTVLEPRTSTTLTSTFPRASN
ncbi:unnamed protein product, partial [Allacma fusca]